GRDTRELRQQGAGEENGLQRARGRRRGERARRVHQRSRDHRSENEKRPDRTCCSVQHDSFCRRAADAASTSAAFGGGSTPRAARRGGRGARARPPRASVCFTTSSPFVPVARSESPTPPP